MIDGGMRNHEERVSWTRFRRAPGGTAPGRGRKSGSRWLCSRDRRRAGPAPPGGSVESCPCTDHLRTEGAGGHIIVTEVHPSGGELPTPTWAKPSLFTGALAAGLAVTGPFPGGPQVERASDAEGLVGSQALDLPGLHPALAGAGALGRPPLPN